jgi:hypothetical protein
MRQVALVGLALVSSSVFAACGGSKPKAESPADAPAPAETASSAKSAEKPAEPAAEETTGMPEKCSGKGSVCLPDAKWVRRLCNGVYPNVALTMFRGGTPWTRGYVTRKTKAWNASGGASAGDEWVAFDEEVILLYERVSDTGGMQVSGAGGGYDALRWDGSCITLSTEEVTTQKAPSPKHGHIDWRYIEEPIQDALRKDEKVSNAFRDRRKECKGAFSGEVSDKCVKADAALTSAIVDSVRGGIELPKPEKLP